MAKKNSIFGRSFELAKLTVKVGMKELQSGNLKSRIEQAKLITESLSELKGAAMKAGQLLSLDLADYFPPEAIQILSQLQNLGSSLPTIEIQKILQEELGPQRFQELRQISEQSAASASIAQVHSAEYQGQKVALKIQHPGVAESISSDLKILKRLATSFVGLTNRQIDLNPLFDEFELVLRQEVDFLQEAQFLKQYQAQVQKMGAMKTSYTTPTLIPEMTTKKILTMTWEKGISLTQWMTTNPSQEKKNHLAHLILNLYCEEFFHWGLVQTDPNFSNFLIQDDGSDFKLVILDFGATRVYTKEFIADYVQLLEKVRAQDDAALINYAIQFGMISSKESAETKNDFVQMMKVAAEPFFVLPDSKSSTKNSKLFKFADKDYSLRSRDSVQKFIRGLKYSPPPHKIIFLHRKLGGIFALLKRLDVQLDITPYWSKMMGPGL